MCAQYSSSVALFLGVQDEKIERQVSERKGEEREWKVQQQPGSSMLVVTAALTQHGPQGAWWPGGDGGVNQRSDLYNRTHNTNQPKNVKFKDLNVDSLSSCHD